MTGTWATSGVDLHLEVGGPRVRAGLENALRDAVRTGRLPPGARLPSSRALAGDLGIARNTVADAYGQLIAEGWLVARRGSGTRVAERAPEMQAAATPTREEDTRLSRYDLRAGSPDLSAFPRSAWLAASRRALNAAPFATLGYGDPRGRPELRRALAGYLARVRGVRVTPERLVICSGFTQGLGLVCQVLRSRGARTLAVEAYGQPSHREVAVGAGLDVRALPVDPLGAVVAELGDADAALLTPAHQFPLGVLLAPARRIAAVDWAQRTAGIVIEDDYDGEFRYDRQPVGAMQALAPEHVVYAGTASKTLAPGLRVGWVALPAGLVDDVAAAKERADRHTGALEQLTLAELLESGAYDRHIRRSRLAYRRRRDRLVTALRRQAPQVDVTGVAAGLHAVVRLPAGRDEGEVVARVAEHGVAVEGLADYRAGEPGHGPALVVGYGTPPDHAFTAAIARLTAALEAGGRSELPQHAPQNAMVDAGEIARFYDRCSDLMRDLLGALAAAPHRRRTFPQVEDALGWPHRRIASVLGGVARLRQTEFAGRRPYRLQDEHQSRSGRWEIWMDAGQAQAVLAARNDC
jgi:GntR family transcriptional regulator / MocR family aminotransferase